MNSPHPAATIGQWLAEPLPGDVSQSLSRLASTDDVHYLAIMPDVHIANEVCTGTVVATKKMLYPHAVGNDIGCGMAALGFQVEADLLAGETMAARLLAGLYRTVPAMRHSRRTMRQQLPDSLHHAPLSDPRLERLKARDGRVQFATLGRGNHFIEFQADEHQRLWLMVHSGSRAMGQAISEHHLVHCSLANTGLPGLDAASAAGQAYLADQAWASRYAEESRQTMMQTVAELVRELFRVDADPDSAIRCNHNHVRCESHFGAEFWVHRKGAISAQEGEPGIIPGSMGAPSFHVEGRGKEESLQSSSHGAGRRMSRAQAFRAVPTRELHRQMKHVWFDHRHADQLRDEAPSAYKDIQAVMRAQRDLTRIVRKLRPILSYKGT